MAEVSPTNQPDDGLDLGSFMFPMSLYDRPGMAMANLTKGDVDASIKSIFSPSSLSPQNRRPLFEQFRKSPFGNAVLDVVSNPLVLIGIALSMRFPVSKTYGMFNQGDKLAGYAKKLGPMGKWLGTPDNHFANHPELVEAIYGVTERTTNFRTQYVTKLEDIYTNYRKVVGRGMRRKEEVVLGLMSDGAHKADSGFNKVLNMLLKHQKKGAVTTGLRSDWMSSFEPRVQKGLKQAHKELSGLYKETLNQFPKAHHKDISDILETKSFHFHNRSMVSPFTGAPSKGAKPTIGLDIKDYHPHRIIGIEQAIQEGPISQSQLGDMATGANQYIASSRYARRLSTPAMHQLKEVADLMDPRAMAAFQEAQSTANGRFMEAIRQGLTKGTPDKVNSWMNRLLHRGYGVRKDVAGRISREITNDWSTLGESAAMKRASQHAGLIGKIPEYELRASKAADHYGKQLSLEWGWTSVPKGKAASFGTVLKGFAAEGRLDSVRKSLLVNDYLPLLRGMKTFPQVQRSLMYNDMKFKFARALETPAMKTMFSKTGKIGERVRQQMIEMIGESSPFSTESGAGAAIASWVYHGTLGFNPAPPIKNLFQTVVTTNSLLGPGAVMKGFMKVGSKVPKYYSSLTEELRKGTAFGVADERAMRKVWPEFMKTGQAGRPMLSDITEEAKPLFVQGIRRRLEQGKGLSMAMFTGTERFNRVLAWEAGLARMAPTIASGKVPMDQIYNQAAQVVRTTQFPGGSVGIPRMFLNVPAPLRQFSQFPSRLLNYLASSTSFGAEEKLAKMAAGQFPAAAGARFTKLLPFQKISPTLDLGTIGRAMAGSAATYSLLKNAANVDVSDALVFGGLPAPAWKSAPFYPAPYIPPVVGLMGGAVTALKEGTSDPFTSQLPMMVPGGLVAKRMIRNLSPRYADYQNPDEMGRIPLYDRNNKLISYQSKGQLVAKAAGVKLADQEGEQQFVQYLLKQRDQILAFRKEYIEAILSHDTQKARAIQSQFTQKYPEAGPLQVKKSDIQTLRKRKDMTRVQRVMKSMPSAYQPMFQQMVGMTKSEYLMKNLDNSLALY